MALHQTSAIIWPADVHACPQFGNVQNMLEAESRKQGISEAKVFGSRMGVHPT